MKKAIALLPLSSLFLFTGCNEPQTTQYTVKFVNWDGNVLQETKVDEGTVPVYEGEVPTRSAPVNHEYLYVGWDKELEKVEADVTYTATFDYVFNFGSYPQTLITDLDLIAQLDNISSTDNRGYKTIGDKQYYEYACERAYTSDDGTHVSVDDETYKYYEVKPIQWTILVEENNKAFYTTYKLIATQIYRFASDGTLFNNRYDQSVLNTWLNYDSAPDDQTDIGGFAWRAFTPSELGSISDTNVDNTAATTCDENNRWATDDPLSAKVFSLSRLNLYGQGDGDFKDERYEFSGKDHADKSKTALTTDFARAQGAAVGWDKYKNCGMYWTRSPSDNDWTGDDNLWAYTVMTDGYIIQNTVNDMRGYCARPAIRF